MSGDGRPSMGSVRALLPSARDYAGISRSWRRDLIAGVTVGVVALPLALAFGITSGLGAAAGLVTAVVAGLVAGVFGGSNVQVSGPTGAMTVVLVPIVARHGIDAVLVVAMLAGALIVLAGVAGFGRFLAFIPWPVIEGFSLGIAVIIFLQQVPAAIGVPKPEGENTVVVAFRAIGEATSSSEGRWALGLCLGVVAIMVLGPMIHRSLPASLLAVAAATIVASAFDSPAARIGAIPDSLPSPSIPDVDLGLVSDLFGAVIAVAALAALESLLSAKVADGMAGVGRHDPNRELVGQGLANIVSPVFGGMPATGAIARTAVNVKAGAGTRLASIIHAGVLVAVIYLVSGPVAEIPLAALAGVLMVTAARMVDVHNLRTIVGSTRSDALILAITGLVTVTFDLIVAVEVGMAAAAVLALRQLARTSVLEADPLPLLDAEAAEALRDDHIVSYRLDGALFFGAVQQFLDQLTRVGDVRVVLLRLPDLQMIDATGAQAIGEIIEHLESRGVTVLVKGPRPEHLRILRQVGAIDQLAHENHLFDELGAAIDHARLHAARHTGHHDTASRTSAAERK